MVTRPTAQPAKTEDRRTNFIGRIQEQRQFRVALQGLFDHHRRWRDLSRKLGSRFDPDQAPGDESYTRIFLLHGIGGIGKSWLTRRCLALATELESDPAVLTLYDDVSLGSPVLEPADLMERFYDQLSLAGYKAELTPYRQAQIETPRLIEKVTRYRLEHRDHWQTILKTASAVATLTETNSLQATPAQPAAVQTLSARQLNDPVVLATANQLLAERMQQQGQLTRDEANLFLDPTAGQAARLVEGLCRIVQQRPVVIALDNLEILVHLEPFIRDGLVLPTIHWPMFWLLSGRQSLADERTVEIEGKKQVHKGYRDLLGENPPLVWDMSIFGDADLHEYLEEEAQRRRIALTIDDNLIAAVKTTSSGIPLVVEMIADALFTLDRADFWQNFTLADSTLLPSGRLEQITTRFLRYCLSREDDLERVQGLALLLKGADEAAIRAVWALPPEQRVADVLHEMRMRYAFVQAEGLHDAVYGFVRRQLLTLRKHIQVRGQLSQRAVSYYRGQWEKTHEAPTDPVLRTCDPNWQEMTRDLLNALLWAAPTEAMDFFLARFVEGLGFENTLADKLLSQIEEFIAESGIALSRPYTELLPRLRLGLKDLSWYIDEPGQAVAQMVEALLKTSELESLHLSILNLWLGRWFVGEQQYDQALATYLTAEQQLPQTATILRQQLGRAYYQLSGRFLWPERISDTVPSEPGIQAAQRAVALDPENGDAWYNLGLALETFGRSEEAVPAFQNAIEIDPRSVHFNSLGNAYLTLDRHQEAADAFRQSSASDPAFAWPHHGLGLIHSERGQYEQAISYYQQAISLHEHDLDRAASWDGLGDVYSALGRYQEALEAYQQGLKLNPNDGLLYYSLGDVYLVLDRHDEAIESYRQAIELEPDYGWSYHKLGLIYGQQGQYSAAMTLYQQAVERHQADRARAVSWTSLGDVHSAQDHFDEAMDAYQQALNLDPTYALAWHSLGDVYSQRGRYNQAIDAYRRSIKFNSDNSLSHYQLGNALAALDRSTEAIAAYEQAIDLEPDSAWPYHNLAYVLQKLGQIEQAIRLYQQALERHEDDFGQARSWDNLGNAYTAVGKYEEAVSAYQKAGILDPAYPWSHHNLGLIYAEQGQYNQAIAHFQQAVERHKNDRDRARASKGLGDAYRALDLDQTEDEESYTAQAIEAYRQAIKFDPEYAQPWGNLGGVYRELDQLEQAIATYQQAIKLDPTDALLWNNLGDAYRAQNRGDEATGSYRKAIELDPTVASPYRSLGLIHEQRGAYEASISFYQQAIERYQQDADLAEVWNQLGDVLVVLERNEEAAEAYQEAIALNPTFAWPYHNLGRLSEKREAYEEAVSWYQQALERHQNDQDRISSWNNLGNAYQSLSHYDEAIATYRRVVESDPGQARTWNMLGTVYTAVKRFEVAIEAFEQAVELEPTYAWAYHNLGYVHEKQEAYETAAPFYRQAIKRHQNDVDSAVSWNNLGNVQRALERFEAAIEAYQRAIDLNPIYALPWDSLGDVYLKLKRYEEAAQAYQQAIELDPTYPWPYNNLGLVYIDREDHLSAISHFEQAIERHQNEPDRAVSWNNLGNAYLALERIEEAIDAYQQAIKLDPSYAWPYNNLGLVWAAQNECEVSITHYEQAIARHQSDENKAVSWDNLGNAYAALGRYKEAGEAFQQAIKLDSSYALPWYNLGQVHHELKRFEEAIDAFLQAIRLDTTFASPWSSLGDVYRILAREDEAIEAYQHAIKLDPTYPWPYHHLGLIYEHQGEYEQAIVYYRQAIKRHESDQHRSVLWSNLGNVYRTVGRPEAAIKAYQQAIELDSSNARPRYRLGNLLAALKRPEAASEAYRRAIELAPDDPWAYHNLAMVYEQSENYETAASLYQQAIARHQNDHDRALAWNNLGNTFSRQWHYSQAIDAYRQAIELDPKLALPWSGLGDVYSTLRHETHAIEAYRRAIELDPSQARSYINLGFIYEQLGQYEQAAPLYQQVIEHHQSDKDRAVSWTNLGNVYRAMARHQEAIEAYQQAIKLDPNYTWPYHNLAALYESRGKHEQALALYQQATQRRKSAVLSQS